MPGFVGTVYTNFYEVVNPTIFLVSTYVADPTNALAGLNSAIAAVKANGGGTLRFTASQTYTISGSWDLVDAEDVKLEGNGATIKMANGVSSATSTMQWRRVRNFHWEDLTVDANSAGRAAQITNSVTLFEANSPAIGGGRASLARCSFINGLGDGLTLRGADSLGTDPTKHSQNLLLYKCNVTNAGRNGLTINNAHNVQVLGGSMSHQQGEKPCSGCDIEPNAVPTSGPAASNILYRGVTCSENNGKGIHLSTGKGGANGGRAITIEGCLFTDGAPAPDPNNQGSGVNVIAHEVLIQKNTFSGFTRTNQQAIIFVGGGNAMFSDDYLIFDNSFNDIQTGDPCVNISSSAQVGSVVDNRGFNCNGALVANGNGAETTLTNNTTVGAASQPVPTPPWDVTFANEGGGGGDLPVYVAKLGETIEADATAGATTPTAVTVQAMAGSCVIVSISFADQSSLGQAVSTVSALGAVAAIFLGALTSGSNPRRQELWGYIAPPAGAATITVTYNQTVNAARVTVHQYSLVDSFGQFFSNFGGSAAQSLEAETTRVNSKIFVGALGYRSNAVLTAPQYTPGANLTERTDNVTGGTINRDISFMDMDLDVAAIGAVSITSTSVQSQNWVLCGVELKSTVQTTIVAPTGFAIAFSRSNANVQISTPSTIVSIPFSFPIITSLNTIDTLVIGTVNVDLPVAGFADIAFVLGSIDAFATILTPEGFDIVFTLGDPSSIIGWLPDAPVESSWEEDTPL